MRIIEATSSRDFDCAAQLMREFLEWTRTRFREMPEVVDSYYDLDAWESELAALGTHYTRPDGGVLLAMDGDAAVGCVALIRFDETICEMKRLYVSDSNHRRGAGHALCSGLLDLGRELGFRHMRLETGDLQVEAQSLYHSIGFYEIAAYRPHPKHLLDHMICMERQL